MKRILKIDYEVGKNKLDKIFFYYSNNKLRFNPIFLINDTIIFPEYLVDFNVLRLTKITGNSRKVIDFNLGKDSIVTCLTFSNKGRKRRICCYGIKDRERYNCGRDGVKNIINRAF